jgi:glucose-6-phosphate isomerase
METIKLNLEKIFDFVPKAEVDNFKQQAEQFNKDLQAKTGKGNDFLGWVDLPSSISASFIKEVEAAANELRPKIEVLVVVGIGGSYLGAKSVIDALSSSFPHLQKSEKPMIIFAGQNICEDYMHDLQEVLNGKEYGIAVISKSGTTTEPALAFRILKQHIENKYGKAEAAKRIIAITDASKGALRILADKEGYKTFVIPDDVGGRFSVLTPVGLIPIAIAGFDIAALVAGAAQMEKATGPEVPYEQNIAAQYAAARNALYQAGKTTEIFVNYTPKLHYVAEWWKQLYGESEGKEGKGIYPSSVDFTSDLHSMGQYIQEGMRNIFETVVTVAEVQKNVSVPTDPDNLDSLNFIAGKRMDYVNKMAELGTLLAHVDGGVPNIHITLPRLNENILGQMIYFFERACGISGYILGVNPFDQPGVEAYKKNMFALLGKPGFEEATAELKKRI